MRRDSVSKNLSSAHCAGKGQLWAVQACFFLHCATPQVLRSRALLQAAWIGCSHSVAPTCSGVFHIDCIARAQQTRFYDKHYSRTRGAVPNMLDLRRRSSFPILFRSGVIQLATAQNCFVKCVVVRVRDDVDGVQLRTQPHSTMGTPHPHAVHRPPRERCRHDISQQTRAQSILVFFRNMVSRALRSWS